ASPPIAEVERFLGLGLGGRGLRQVRRGLRKIRRGLRQVRRGLRKIRRGLRQVRRRLRKILEPAEGILLGRRGQIEIAQGIVAEEREVELEAAASARRGSRRREIE